MIVFEERYRKFKLSKPVSNNGRINDNVYLIEYDTQIFNTNITN